MACAMGESCQAGVCVLPPPCGNPGGGPLVASNGAGQNVSYCYQAGDTTQTRAMKACESHFGVAACCVITGGYQDQQYGKCGGGGPTLRPPP